MFSRIQANKAKATITHSPRVGAHLPLSPLLVSSHGLGVRIWVPSQTGIPACSQLLWVPTWLQLLKVHQHPVGRAGIDTQGGGTLKREVTWNADHCFLTEHSLRLPGS